MPNFKPDWTLKTAERLHVEHVLRETKGNRFRAAEILDVPMHRLLKLIEKHSLYRDYARDAAAIDFR